MTKAPRLLVASGIFHPEPGGPATYLHEILPALQALGWQVRVLTFGSDTSSTPYPVMRVPRGALPVRYARYAALALRELAQADLVYAHTVDLPFLTRWPAFPRVPRVLKVVGDFAWERAIRRGWVPPTTDVDAFQTMRLAGAAAANTAARSAQVRAVRGVIVPSEYLRQMVLGWGADPQRVRVIYNALPPMTNDRLTRAQARQRLNLEERPTILTAARLTPWKGVDHLMTALDAVPDACLLVAGDGEDLPRLKALAENLRLGQRVRFMARLPRETLYHAMQAADYFALYSGYEGLAHTLLESLRVGTPLIASAKGGNTEVVRHGVNGLLVPYLDIHALRDTLRLAFSGTLHAELSARTHEGMERFTFDHMVTRTHEALRGWLG
jgi:glycosyltransferase involved in cell wall biosynthesis